MLPAEAPRERRAAVIALRALRGCLSLAVAAALALAAGCGDDYGSGDGASPPAQPQDAASNLTITLDSDGPGGEKPRTATVVCEGSEGTSHEACPVVEELPPDPAAPTPPETPCTEIYGGPDVATITGTVRGEPIDAELTRANGCEIDRFDRFSPLLQELFPGYRPGESLAP